MLFEDLGIERFLYVQEAMSGVLVEVSRVVVASMVVVKVWGLKRFHTSRGRTFQRHIPKIRNPPNALYKPPPSLGRARTAPSVDR